MKKINKIIKNALVALVVFSMITTNNLVFADDNDEQTSEATTNSTQGTDEESSASNSKKVLGAAKDVVTGEVQITNNSLGSDYTISTDGLITATFTFGGDGSCTDRNVEISIPRGLRLVSATGFTFSATGNGNTSYSAATMTPTELNSWEQTTNSSFIQDTRPSADGIDYYLNGALSGTLNYSMVNGVSGGSITLTFEADELLYDYSSNQQLAPLTIKMTGMYNGQATEDDSSTNIIVAPTTNAPTATVTGDTTKYVNKAVAVKVEVSEDEPLGGKVSTDTLLPIYQPSFKLTYPKGATPTKVANYTYSTEIDNGDGTCSTNVTYTGSDIYYLNSGSTVIYNGSVFYSNTKFNVGDEVKTTVSDITWKTLSVDDEGTISAISHNVAGEKNITTTLTKEPDYNPAFTNTSADWEAYDEGQEQVTLSSTYYQNNGGSSYTPVRFEVNCDSQDKVDEVQIYVPPITEGNSTITKTYIEYTDGTKEEWSLDGGTQLPYEVKSYQWAQAGANNNYITYKAASGKSIAKAYVEVDQIIDSGYACHYGYNIKGLPVSSTPGGEYSNHSFEVLQKVDGSWVSKATSNESGFRWKVPNPFEITSYSSDGKNVNYIGDALNSVDLAKYAYVNTSGAETDGKVQWDLDCDTTNDLVSTVWFPLPYNGTISDSANLVEEVSWTNTDGSTGSWTKESGEAFPFTTGSVVLNDANDRLKITNSPTGQYAILNADSGKNIASVSVKYTKWSNANGAGYAKVVGVPKSADPYATKSQHKATLSTLKDNEEESINKEISNKTQGFKWGQLSTMSVMSRGNFTGNTGSVEGGWASNVDVYAGKKATLRFNMTGESYSKMCFALVLPDVLSLDTSSVNWTFQKNNGFPVTQTENIGASLKTTRPATSDELAQAGFTEQEGGTVYIFDATNQLATCQYASGYKRYYSFVSFDVNVDALAVDQVIKWSQISYSSTNQTYTNTTTNAVTGINFKVMNGNTNSLASTKIAGLGATDGNGDNLNNTVKCDNSTITIHKDPKLFITEAVKNSTGDYHTYSGDSKDIVTFGSGETGTIKVSMTNTVETADISAYDNYVFIPIGDGTSLSQQSGFDLKINGAANLDNHGSTIQNSEFKYMTLSPSQTIASTNAADFYNNNGSSSYDSTSNYVAVKLTKLEPGGTVTIEIPVVAPTIKANTTLNDQCSAVSIFYFSGTDKSIYNAATTSPTSMGAGYLYMAYRNALYDVNFNSKGGSSVESQNDIKENDKVTKPTNPTKKGYTFNGWYTSESYTNEYDFNDGVTKDMTLYAKWTENDPVTYKYETSPSKGGTVSLDEENVKPVTGSPKGSKATTKAGYTFLGWYDSEGNQVSTNATYVPSQEDGLYTGGTYTAKFKANEDTPYTVKYYLKDKDASTYTEDTSARVNAQGTTDTEPTSTKKTFTGFEYDKTTYQTDNTSATSTKLDIAGDGSLVIKYYYNRVKYDVSFLAPSEDVATLVKDDGKDSEKVEFEGNPTLNITLSGINPDYLQTGWRYTITNPDETTTVGVITDYKDLEITGNTTIQPVFAHIPFLAGSTDGNGYVKTVEGTTPATEVGNKTTSNYEWDENFVGEYNGSISFQAKDHYKISSITLQVPNGTDKTVKNVPLINNSNLTTISSELVDDGGSVVLTLTDDGHGNYVSGNIVTSKLLKSTSYVINYEKITWDVNFNTQDADSDTPDKQTVDDGEKSNKPANPTKKGYTFGGWYTESTCENKFDFDTLITKDTTLYAKWTENEVTINYASNNTAQGTVDKASETIGVLTGAPNGSTATAKTGYKFVNWTVGGVEVSTDLTFVPQKDTTTGLYETASYKANFTPIKYTIKFNANSGTGAMENQQFTYDENQALTTNTFTKLGYTFKGWSTTPTGNVEYTNSKEVKNLTSTDGDVINLYAIWQANTDTAYKVEYYLQDLNANTYTKKETANLTGTTGGDVQVISNSYDGFTYDSSKTTYENSYTPASTTALTITANGSLVIKLYYSRDDVTLSYDMQGHGTQVPNKTVKYEDTISSPTNPTETGWTFEGWYNNSTFVTEHNFDDPITENMTIYAKWTQNEYTVIYNTAGGSTIANKTGVHFGDASLLPTTTPTREGYTFNGWKLGTTTITDATKYSDLVANDQVASVTLVAQWTQNDYTVHYDLGYTGSTNPEDKTVHFSDTSLLPTAPTREGYTFDGWYVDNTKVTSSTKYSDLVTDDSVSETTLTGKWTPVDYKVTYEAPKADDSSDVPTQTTNNHIKDVITVSSDVPTREGWTFTGWTIKTPTTVTISDGKFTMPASDVVLEANWTQNDYTVHYDLGYTGSTNPEDKTVHFSDTSLLPTAPTREGYTFDGWYVDNTKVTSTTKYSDLVTDDSVSETTLTGKWTPVDYKVTYEAPKADDSSDVPTQTTNNHIKDVIIVSSDVPTREGWTFTGWTIKTPTTVTISDGKFTMPASDVVLEANWTQNDYTVHYDLGYTGSTNPEDKTVHFSDASLLPTAPTREGYTFDGWYVDNTKVTSTTKYSDLVTDDSVSETTLTGKWTPVDYKVTYEAPKADDSSDVPTQTTNNHIKDVIIVSSDVPTREGWTFTGWTIKTPTTVTISDGKFTMPASDVVLEANWTQNDYTVHYDLGYTGSTNPEDKTVHFSDASLLPTAPTRKGYTFDGWYVDNSKVTSSTKYSDLVTDDSVDEVTLTAKWVEKDNYIVHYDTTGGTAISDKTGVKWTDTNLLPTTNPIKTGYTFSKWVQDTNTRALVDVTNSDVFSDLDPNDKPEITLIAVWTVNQYHITFDSNGSKEASTIDSLDITADYDSLINQSTGFPTNPTKDGYYFGGWEYTDSKGNVITVTDVSKLPAENIALKAVWNKENIEAKDFIYSISDGSISNEDAKKLSNLVVLDKDGNPIDLSTVTVDSDQLEVINDAIKNKVIDKSYPLTFTTALGSTITINVTLRENVITDKSTNETIGGNDIYHNDSDGSLSPTDIINLGKVQAYDKDGKLLPVEALSVDATQLAKINEAIANNQGGKFSITITTLEGTQITISVILTPTAIPSTPIVTPNNGVNNKPKTGDDVNVMYNVYGMLISMLIISILALKKKKEEL
ncbi:MAG: InlB B-repeat-containing protein [Thomasclavelia sp.]|nr:InlB B-repeat-containing protein [Thomasclavelia sp.]